MEKNAVTVFFYWYKYGKRVSLLNRHFERKHPRFIWFKVDVVPGRTPTVTLLTIKEKYNPNNRITIDGKFLTRN